MITEKDLPEINRALAAGLDVRIQPIQNGKGVKVVTERVKKTLLLKREQGE